MGCFLWMDDVVLINTNRNTLQEMLDITYKVASRYRIKFGSQKSKVLTIGKPDNHKTLTIDNTELEETETYKYLGMTLNNKGTLQNHIEDIKGKVHMVQKSTAYTWLDCCCFNAAQIVLTPPAPRNGGPFLPFFGQAGQVDPLVGWRSCY